MAECRSTEKQTVEKLSEELTCQTCVDHYTEPKLLHCFRVLFEKCLKPLVCLNQRGQVVECPNCRQSTSLAQEGVPSLQGAFLNRHLFDMHVEDQKGREYRHPVDMRCELVPSDGYGRVRGETEKVSDSQYDNSYQSPHRERHYLHIREDKYISGRSLPLSVLTATPTNIINDIKYPWGLALNNSGQLLVVEHSGHCGHRILIVGKYGKNRRSFSSRGSGPDRLWHPCGVALSATGDIVVTEFCNHRIHIFSPEGKSVRCVGTRGSGPLEFCYPVGIAVHPHSNKIYIVEKSNDRVQVLNEDLTYSSSFGFRGSGNGQFKRLHDVAFDGTGNVYVADTENHRVQVFTENGKYIRQFGKKGNGEGELSEPEGIAIDSNDTVYVSEWGNSRVSLFTYEGHFLRSFGTQGEGPGQFMNPTGITVSNNGVIYISDYSNGRVQVF